MDGDFRILYAINVKFFLLQKNGGGLPPTLYIQADNAGKDNKNNFVLMFLAMLVKAEIVKKVLLFALIYGNVNLYIK